MKAKDLDDFIDRFNFEHFKGSELSSYASRQRKGVKNSLPPESLWSNIIPTLVIANELRKKVGPIEITSAYRSPAYNAAVGGEPGSFHMKFMALDLIPKEVNPVTLAREAKKLRGKEFKIPGSNISFIFKGGIGLYKTFVHIDCREREANW